MSTSGGTFSTKKIPYYHVVPPPFVSSFLRFLCLSHAISSSSRVLFHPPSGCHICLVSQLSSSTLHQLIHSSIHSFFLLYQINHNGFHHLSPPPPPPPPPPPSFSFFSFLYSTSLVIFFFFFFFSFFSAKKNDFQ